MTTQQKNHSGGGKDHRKQNQSRETSQKVTEIAHKEDDAVWDKRCAVKWMYFESILIFKNQFAFLLDKIFTLRRELFL